MSTMQLDRAGRRDEGHEGDAHSFNGAPAVRANRETTPSQRRGAQHRNSVRAVIAILIVTIAIAFAVGRAIDRSYQPPARPFAPTPATVYAPQ